MKLGRIWNWRTWCGYCFNIFRHCCYRRTRWRIRFSMLHSLFAKRDKVIGEWNFNYLRKKEETIIFVKIAIWSFEIYKFVNGMKWIYSNECDPCLANWSNLNQIYNTEKEVKKSLKEGLIYSRMNSFDLSDVDLSYQILI